MILVKSKSPTAKAVYQLHAAPSPHNFDFASVLPTEAESYPNMAVGSVASYIVFKYSFDQKTRMGWWGYLYHEANGCQVT